MLNFYQSNDKSYADAQPVYVATCITHGFFQDLCRTIGDAIFVHIVTSRVYITFMGVTYHEKCVQTQFSWVLRQ